MHCVSACSYLSRQTASTQLCVQIHRSTSSNTHFPAFPANLPFQHITLLLHDLKKIVNSKARTGECETKLEANHEKARDLVIKRNLRWWMTYRPMIRWHTMEENFADYIESRDVSYGMIPRFSLEQRRCPPNLNLKCEIVSYKSELKLLPESESYIVHRTHWQPGERQRPWPWLWHSPSPASS